MLFRAQGPTRFEHSSITTCFKFELEQSILAIQQWSQLCAVIHVIELSAGWHILHPQQIPFHGITAPVDQRPRAIRTERPVATEQSAPLCGVIRLPILAHEKRR